MDLIENAFESNKTLLDNFAKDLQISIEDLQQNIIFVAKNDIANVKSKSVFLLIKYSIALLPNTIGKKFVL